MNQETKKDSVILDVPALQRLVTSLTTSLLITNHMLSHLVPPESEESRLGVSTKVSLMLMIIRHQLTSNSSKVEETVLACNNAELNELVRRINAEEQRTKTHGLG